VAAAAAASFKSHANFFRQWITLRGGRGHADSQGEIQEKGGYIEGVIRVYFGLTHSYSARARRVVYSGEGLLAKERCCITT